MQQLKKLLKLRRTAQQLCILLLKVEKNCQSLSFALLYCHSLYSTHTMASTNSREWIPQKLSFLCLFCQWLMFNDARLSHTFNVFKSNCNKCQIRNSNPVFSTCNFSVVTMCFGYILCVCVVFVLWLCALYVYYHWDVVHLRCYWIYFAHRLHRTFATYALHATHYRRIVVALHSFALTLTAYFVMRAIFQLPTTFDPQL